MFLAEFADLPAVDEGVAAAADPAESRGQVVEQIADPVARLRMIENVEQDVDFPRILGLDVDAAGEPVRPLMEKGDGLQ